MPKVFENVGDSNDEEALRRGLIVPDGAVNIAWVKSPPVNPKNNVIMIDTSNAVAGNRSSLTTRKHLAFSNALGILEDVNGNQIWDEEYPVISDVFADEEAVFNYNFDPEDILPFLHVSRYFHVDHNNIAFGLLESYREGKIRVVNKNGDEFINDAGEKKYRIFIVKSNKYLSDATAVSAPYRIYAFIDYNPEIEELYLEYNKIELNKHGVMKRQEINYREIINPRPYFTYQPEESDVIDRSQEDLKVYSTKPASLKEKILGLPQSNTPGWKIFVPRKAVPDPRIFQLFRWRLACEFTKPVTQSQEQRDEVTPRMRVGVVVPKGGGPGSTRANYFFYQLGISDYNIANIDFYNPLSESSFDDSTTTNTYERRQQATYWHVDIDAIALSDLDKFDFLIWAPTVDTNVAPYLAKIDYFTKTIGGTIAFESSSQAVITGIPELTYSTVKLQSSMRSTDPDTLTMNTLRFFDATPGNQNDTFTNFGMWQVWPPDISDIINSYSDTASIIKSAENIAGWDIETGELDDISPYLDEVATLSNAKWQMLTSTSTSAWKRILEARKASDSTYYGVVFHKRFTSGGGIFTSSACIFEDHLFDTEGNMLTKTLNIPTIQVFESLGYAETLDEIVNSTLSSVEMKIRLNMLLFASIFKPSPNDITKDPEAGLANFNNQTQSVTIYSNWYSDWVINPEDGVLSDDEKDEFKFILQPTTVDGQELKWQRVLHQLTAEKIIQKKIKELDPNSENPVYNAFPGAQKRYFILATNPLVQVPSTEMLNDDSQITAWTDAYSPRLEVPADIGPHIIRDEMVAGTGNNEGRRIFPPKPYELQTKATYIVSDLVGEEVTATVTINGTFYQTRTIPDRYETRKVLIPGTAGRYVDRVMHWNPDGANRLIQFIFPNMQGAFIPLHIHTWTDANYMTSKSSNWPFMGEYGTHSRNINNYGERVKRIQSFLNQMIYFKLIQENYYPEHGKYDAHTERGIRKFQQLMNAQYIDGVVDAETWSLIGYMLMHMSNVTSDDGTTKVWMRDAPIAQTSWATQAKQYMRLETISDGQTTGPAYGRQSWFTGGPSTIFETFNIGFTGADISEMFPGGGNFESYQISIMPWMIGNHNSVSVDWVDVRGSQLLYAPIYDWRGNPGTVWNKSGGDGQWIHINFPPVSRPTSQDTNYIFRLRQDGPAGWGTARFLGIRDVSIYAKKYYPGTPSYYDDQVVFVPGRTYQLRQDFTTSFRYTFRTGEPVVFTPFSTNIGKVITRSGEKYILGTLDNITEATWDPDTIQFSTLSDDFEVSFGTKRIGSGATARTTTSMEITYNGGELNVGTENFVYGPRFGHGQNTFYTKTPDNIKDQYSRTYGWITKQDGIKLICDVDGKPYGFPTTLPGNVNGLQDTHFTRYSLKAFNTDQTVHYGFYDIVRKEFMTNKYGWPEISYYDYIRRGPQNVYIAVQTTYELDSIYNLPNGGESIERPFKWVMPAYGVTTGLKSKIQLEPLSPHLTNKDVWPIPVKTGSFAKEIALRPKSSGSIVGTLSDYQGTTITAYYDIVEANSDTWSSLYGRPYRDIRGESPLILDDNTIKVRQTPILMVQEITDSPSLSDPWRPVFSVFIRRTLDSEWRKLDLNNIQDYNIWTGEITLRDSLSSNDPRLVKVEYTTQRPVYNLRHDGTNKINLNPYINQDPEWLNVPLYVYMNPAYILDSDNELIEDTVRSRTLSVSRSPDVFNASKVDYDPTAMMLGIVYISTAMDLNDLKMLDTRRRGGGATLRLNDLELAKNNPELYSFTDIESNQASSYQAGGFVVIRLPIELGEYYTEQQIRQVIERNITAGVRYKLEDLYGYDYDPNRTYPWLGTGTHEVSLSGWSTLTAISSTYNNARQGLVTPAMATGPNVTAGQAFIVGEYYCFQSLLTFTMELQEGRTITSAKLLMTSAGDFSTTDFTIEAYKYDYGTEDTGDFASGTELGTLNSNNQLIASYNTSSGFSGEIELTNDSDIMDLINQDGTVQILLSSSRQRGGNTPSGNEFVSFTASSVILEIEVE